LRFTDFTDYFANMTFAWLKSILPKGLYGRAAMILLVPVITIQLVVSVTFIQRHFDGVTQQMSVNIVRDVSLILKQIDDANDTYAVAKVINELALPLGYAIVPTEAIDLNNTDSRAIDDLTGANVITTLRAGIPAIDWIDLKTNGRIVRLGLHSTKSQYSVTFDRSRVSASAPHQLLVMMIIISILMTLISFIFLRNQVRPIRRLARAAEAFGRGRNIPYRVSGATEVRAAGQAFLAMRDRIERHIEQRTLMLSGVSHDLRTPLTRLKLGLSLSEPSEETTDLIRDVDDMEVMLEEFLAFARGDSLEETVLTDPVQLAQQVIDEFGRDEVVPEFVLSQTDTPFAQVRLRPNAVRRALQNLINNAARYGNLCRLSMDQTAGSIRFIVEDNGPGIPVAQRDLAIRPFIRLDSARNQDHGTGVGLGLSIVMDIASSHGGALELLDSEELGGLKVVLTLPR
jgi:two-component system, OmpR family, osmolarity sensor histidine kinase EnvZ